MTHLVRAIADQLEEQEAGGPADARAVGSYLADLIHSGRCPRCATTIAGTDQSRVGSLLTPCHCVPLCLSCAEAESLVGCGYADNWPLDVDPVVPQLVGYLRTSLVEPTLVAEQREQLAAGAERLGYGLVEIIEELPPGGVSDAAWDRLFLQIKGGTAVGVLALSLDRIARSLQDFVTLATWIDDAGGRLVTLADRFDSCSTEGKLLMRLVETICDWDQAMRSDSRES